jgi:hypothetical protein
MENRMDTIRWESTEPGTYDGYAGDLQIAAATRTKDGWFWLVGWHGGLRGKTKGDEADLEVAQAAAEACWNENVARWRQISSVIDWRRASDMSLEGYEGDLLVARIGDERGPWHWRLAIDDSCPWQQTSGAAHSEDDAKRQIVECRNDQIARTGKGIVRWENPSKNDWYAYSGRKQVGFVMNPAARGFLAYHIWSRDAVPTVTAHEGRKVVEDHWSAFLEETDLAPRQRSGIDW